jgi:hypothetical protein
MLDATGTTVLVVTHDAEVAPRSGTCGCVMVG